MNKVLRISLILGLFPLLNLIASADGVVVFPTGDAAWTVDITPQNPSSGASTPGAPATNAKVGRQPQHVEVMQLNHLKRIRITWTDGMVTEKWSVPEFPAMVFEEDPRNGVVTGAGLHNPMTAIANFYLTYDSFAFSWLTPEDLKEKDPISYHGKQCFHYLGTSSSPSIAGHPGVISKREAWIDARTLLPVALDNQTSLSVFTFAPKPPTGTLVLPPKFQKDVNSYKMARGLPLQ